jgi:hypothetical protein
MLLPTAIGPHGVRVQGDLIEMVFTGPITLADVAAMRDLLAQVRGAHGRCYMLADATGLTGINLDARKAMADWGRSTPEDQISGVGLHGMNFAMRALSALTLGAIKLMSGREVVVHFARDPAEARAWIAKRRALDRAAPSA